jgi:hypothetical protein
MARLGRHGRHPARPLSGGERTLRYRLQPIEGRAIDAECSGKVDDGLADVIVHCRVPLGGQVHLTGQPLSARRARRCAHRAPRL